MEERFCCACLTGSERLKVRLSEFYDISEGLTYGDCIKKCTNVDFEEKHYFCESCLVQFQTFYAFYKSLLKSQRILSERERKSTFEDDEMADSEVVEEEFTEVETLDFEYQLEETSPLGESAELEELNMVENAADEVSSILNADEVVCFSDHESERMDESSQLIDNDAVHQLNRINENANSATIHSEEVTYQRIEIIPKVRSTPNCIDAVSLSEQETNTEKPRKRFYGKFSCDYCDKLFPNHSRMIAHRRSHEPDRPKFACNECGRIYSTNQALDVHIRTAHQMSGYACNICSKVFSAQANLTVHMRFHTKNFPYVCEVCGKNFWQLCHLNTHRNVKHNSVRFCCSHRNCGKLFTSSASLRNHEYSHGLMPFECSFCQREYPCKSKLKVHVRKAHKKDLTLEELEPMRRFHVMRSRPNIIKIAINSLENKFSEE